MRPTEEERGKGKRKKERGSLFSFHERGAKRKEKDPSSSDSLLEQTILFHRPPPFPYPLFSFHSGEGGNRERETEQTTTYTRKAPFRGGEREREKGCNFDLHRCPPLPARYLGRSLLLSSQLPYTTESSRGPPNNGYGEREEVERRHNDLPPSLFAHPPRQTDRANVPPSLPPYNHAEEEAPPAAGPLRRDSPTFIHKKAVLLYIVYYEESHTMLKLFSCLFFFGRPFSMAILCPACIFHPRPSSTYFFPTGPSLLFPILLLLLFASKTRLTLFSLSLLPLRGSATSIPTRVEEEGEKWALPPGSPFSLAELNQFTMKEFISSFFLELLA